MSSSVALNQPVTFDAANQWLAGRVSTLTSLGAKDLVLSPDFDAAAKAQAFFSAKVAETHILDRLRDVSDRFSKGEMNLATARTELKQFLWGEGYAKEDISGETKAGAAITNLASSARLDLILNQNARMAAAVGNREVAMSPAIKKRFPYFRYVPSVSKNPRDDHAPYYDTVLPKDDPFWQTHTPPLDYNCKCGLEDLTEEEAQDYGVSTSEPVEPGNPDGDWKVISPDGTETVLARPESGYVFDVDSAFKTFDLSSVTNPVDKLAISDAAQIEFGDRVKIQNDIATVIPAKVPYKNWEEEKLPSASTWSNLPSAPALYDADKARGMLEKELSVIAADGVVAKLGRALLDHWEIEKNKNAKDVIGRLIHLSWAMKTLESPYEIWEQDTQKIYLQLFARPEKNNLGCLVAIEKNGNARSYLLKTVKATDAARKGKKVHVTGDAS